MTCGEFADQLQATGTTPAEITDVVITHFHNDHHGWLLDENGAETFPNAQVWVGERDLAFFRDVAEGIMQLSEPMQQLFDRLAQQGRLQTVTDAVIGDGISIHDAPGHTPGHIVVKAESQGQTLWMLGDAVTIPHQIERPQWHSCGDIDPALAQQTRDALYAELEKPNTWGVGSHFPHLIPGAILVAQGRRWSPAGDTDPVAVHP